MRIATLLLAAVSVACASAPQTVAEAPAPVPEAVLAPRILTETLTVRDPALAREVARLKIQALESSAQMADLERRLGKNSRRAEKQRFAVEHGLAQLITDAGYFLGQYAAPPGLVGRKGFQLANALKQRPRLGERTGRIPGAGGRPGGGRPGPLSILFQKRGLQGPGLPLQAFSAGRPEEPGRFHR